MKLMERFVVGFDSLKVCVDDTNFMMNKFEVCRQPLQSSSWEVIEKF
jgi:hypothetical protein